LLFRCRVAEIASSVVPPPFKPRTGVKIAVTEAEAKEQMEKSEGMLQQVVQIEGVLRSGLGHHHH